MNSLNVERQSDIIRALRGYVGGSVIKVTYYHKMDPMTDDQALDNDISASQSSVHDAFLKINNFELRLPSGFSFNYSQDNHESELTLTGTTYAGFEAKIGDIFLYEFDQGKLGKFLITTPPKRLSIRSGTCMEITGYMQQIMDIADVRDFERGVREVSWFVKDRFLLDDSALVSSDEMVITEQLKDKVSELTPYYIETFFDRATMNTFMRKDGVYDPYVVAFVQNVMDYTETHLRPEQLLPEMTFERFGFYAKILNPKQVPMTTYKDTCVLLTMERTTLSTRLNALLNKDYLKLIAADDTAYPNTSKHPYGVYTHSETLDDELAGTFHELIHTYWTLRNIDADLLLRLMTEYTELTDDEQFYIIPVYLYLARLIIDGVISGADVQFRYTNSTP